MGCTGCQRGTLKARGSAGRKGSPQMNKGPGLGASETWEQRPKPQSPWGRGKISTDTASEMGSGEMGQSAGPQATLQPHMRFSEHPQGPKPVKSILMPTIGREPGQTTEMPRLTAIAWGQGATSRKEPGKTSLFPGKEPRNPATRTGRVSACHPKSFHHPESPTVTPPQPCNCRSRCSSEIRVFPALTPSPE